MYPHMRLRLEVDGMKAEIARFLETRHSEIAGLLDAAIADELAAPAMDDMIRREVGLVVQEAVRSALKQAVQKAVWSDEVSGEIEKIARSATISFLVDATKERP